MNQSPQQRIPAPAGVAACSALLLLAGWPIAGLAQDSANASASDNAIVASLNPVPQGLACSQAADQAQVSFDFQKPDFDIKQVSLYIDGHGVPQDSVTQQWPRITLSRGLHEGRNAVEIVATGDNDHSIARQLIVLIGVAQQAGDENAAVVDCDNSRSQVAETPPPIQQPQQQVYAPPPTEGTTTVYVQQPVYVYQPVPAYPVWPVFVPIIPVVIGYPPFPVWYGPRPYCPPPVVSYYPAPPPYAAPPVGYRPPPYQPSPGNNSWRTPNPITGTPMPLNGVPQPYSRPYGPVAGGAQRPSRATVVYSTQSSPDPRWGVVNDMNAGGPPTRYRTPPPQGGVVMQQNAPQYGQPYSSHQAAPGYSSHGQQSQAAPMQPMTRQNYVHEMQAPQFQQPHPMPPPRMTAAPAYHPPMHGGGR